MNTLIVGQLHVASDDTVHVSSANGFRCHLLKHLSPSFEDDNEHLLVLCTDSDTEKLHSVTISYRLHTGAKTTWETDSAESSKLLQVELDWKRLTALRCGSSTAFIVIVW